MGSSQVIIIVLCIVLFCCCLCGILIAYYMKQLRDKVEKTNLGRKMSNAIRASIGGRGDGGGRGRGASSKRRESRGKSIIDEVQRGRRIRGSVINFMNRDGGAAMHADHRTYGQKLAVSGPGAMQRDVGAVQLGILSEEEGLVPAAFALGPLVNQPEGEGLLNPLPLSPGYGPANRPKVRPRMKS